MFQDIDKKQNFSVSFQYLLKRFSARKLPLIATKYYELCTVLKVLSFNNYLSKNGTKWKKVKMRNFLLNYLRYRDSNQTMNYIDYNRIKGSLD